MRLLFCFLLCPAALASAATLEMSPSGPVSSLLGARDAARQLRSAGAAGPIVVHVANGVYPITEAVTFEPQDSGLAFEAAPGARPVLNGGRKISGFVAGPDGIWTAHPPEARDGHWKFESLWVNGRRTTRARTPNEGFYNATGQPTQALPGVPLNGDAAHVMLRVTPADAGALKGLSADELHDANLIAYHTWDVGRYRIAGARVEDGTLQFTGGRQPFFKPEQSQRFVLENFRGALDAPGEWFLARDGTVSYIPRPGETPDTADVWAPVAPQWLVFKGDPAGKPVENIHFRGLKFEHQAYTLPEQGVQFGQAESGLGAAIEADGAKGIAFEDCEFTRTLTNVAWFKEGCHDITMRHCRLQDLGAGGVKIGSPNVSDAGPRQSDHVVLDDCIIQSGGRYFPGAIGVTIFHASDCTIRHCDIADFFYTAVSIGWTWGYHPTSCARNTVESCELHHLGWAVLSDMGAVYTLGPQPGTVIRGCHIHDIGSATYGGWGMYNDEGSTGIVWENNLVDHTQDAGYHQHYGRGNIVRNNIIAYCAEEHIRRSRPEAFFAFAFERNIVFAGDGQLFEGGAANWLDGHVDLHQNVYWKPGGVLTNFAGKSWADWQSQGLDTGSCVADPKFVDPAHGDWTLRPDSPALKAGFVPFDWKQAGVSGDESWKKLAAESFPPMRYGGNVPPRFVLHDGFETTPLGGKPARAWEHVADRNAIAVVADHPSKGERCLQLTDDASIQPLFDPHFFYSPHHSGGTTRIAFDVQAEPAYQLVIEWRDSVSPYRTGPMLVVQNGVLTANGTQLAEVRSDAWTHVEMIAKLGAEADGTWTCTVTESGKDPKKHEGLKFVNPDMKTLDWFGFSSPGTAHARCWLDEIDVENKP